MGLFGGFFRRTSDGHALESDDVEGYQRTEHVVDKKEDPVEAPNHELLYASDGDSESASSVENDGVKKAQATTIVWTKNALIIAYVLIFVIFFVNSLQQQISGTLTAYVTSAFDEHALLSTTNVLSQLVAGVIKLPVAKLMDIWGRPQGFVFMLLCAVIGLIMMAATPNIETYAAAQVFYWVGFNGIAYVLDVFIADTSSLKWRGLMFAFSTSPYIATSFAGPSAAQSFEDGAGWRWAFGAFAIITPAMSAPFLGVFWYNQRLAKKQGVLVDRREASGRTWWQSLHHYLIEFDFIGMILIIAGWALLLLPLSLATYQASKWKSPSIITMLVVGFCCLIAFGIHERFFARKPFLPFHFLLDGTVIGSCLCAATLFISFYCWDLYFQSFLQVVYDLSIEDAGYIYRIYSLGSCFWGIVVGLLIPATGRFKWLAVAAVPLQILGTGLMIFFRQAHSPLGYVIMCQIFIAFAGGTLVICQEIAIMAVVGPDNIAVALALQALFTAIGGAIGTSVSGAIWTNTLPQELERRLPANLKSQALDIYASLPVQLSYAWGTPAREAIIEAYSQTQRYLCIAGTAVLALQIVWVLMWRDIHVRDFKKPRGAKIV